MLIDLSYDLVVELQFLVTGRYPTALMDKISRVKTEIYQKNLMEDLRRADLLSGSREFEVQGRKFTVLFASDTRQNDDASDIRPLRVMDVREHK